MREKRTFAERTRVLKSEEVKRKFFLVYEGSNTEVLYFDAIRSSRNCLGRSPLIELVPLIRSYSEDGWSNPKKLVHRLIDNLDEEKTGQLTYESLLNRIMDYLYDQKILTTSKVQARAIWKMMVFCCTIKLEKSLSDYVDDLEKDCNVIIKHLNEESDVVNIIADISEIIKSSNITYDERFDKICLIVDRDKESFVARPENNQYEYVMTTCRKKDFRFYVTNPCFEFWLLLHFDEVFWLDREKLLENPKVSKKRRYTESELRKLLPGYSKDKYNVSILMDKVDVAVRNEKKFCEDIERLELELGSNIGLLIKELSDFNNEGY